MIHRGLSVLLSAAIAVGGTTAAFHFEGIRVNASASLPIGLYCTTSDGSGKLVEFCPAEPYSTLSAERGYRGKGHCPDAAEPLMKPVVAVAGDIVRMSPRGVAVNGVLLPNSAPLSVDTKNRPLKHWPFSIYSVAPGTVWVISSFSPRSFDSRYFGPIPVTRIRSYLRPLVTE